MASRSVVRWLVSLVLLFNLACSSGVTDSSERSGPGVEVANPLPAGEEGHAARSDQFLLLQTVPVFDRQGWGQPVIASMVLLPSDWSVEGGYYWNLSTTCASDFINRRFLARSPDGKLAFEMLPVARWQWGREQVIQAEIQMRGCRLAPPINPPGALQQYIIPSFRPGASVLDIRPSPQAADGALQEYYRIWGPLFQMQNARVHTGAIKATIEYAVGGQAYQEWVLLTVAEIMTPSVAGSYFSYLVDFVYTFRAPRGELERYEPLFSAIVSSVRNNPAWETAIVQLVANINSNISIQAGNRASIWQNAMNQIGRVRMQTWQRSQQTVSRVSASWSRALRGVDRYIDPISQQYVELPTGYRNAWSNGNGSYIVSPDPSFDPNTNQNKGNWQRMRMSER